MGDYYLGNSEFSTKRNHSDWSREMTRDELDQEIARLTALRDALPKEWPQVGDEFHLLEGDGLTRNMVWDGLQHEKRYLERGLIKRTSEEAERADKKRMAIHKWNTLAGDQSWVDWDDERKFKYRPAYSYARKQWGAWSERWEQHWLFAHHKTKAECEAAIKEMGEMMDWMLL